MCRVKTRFHLSTVLLEIYLYYWQIMTDWTGHLSILSTKLDQCLQYLERATQSERALQQKELLAFLRNAMTKVTYSVQNNQVSTLTSDTDTKTKAKAQKITAKLQTEQKTEIKTEVKTTTELQAQVGATQDGMLEPCRIIFLDIDGRNMHTS